MGLRVCMWARMGKKVGVSLSLCKCLIEQIACVYVSSTYPLAMRESAIYAQDGGWYKWHKSETFQKYQAKAL